MNKLLEQKNIGVWWGAFRNLGSYVSFYVFVFNTVMILINTLILGNMAVYGLPIPMWAVLIIAVIGFFTLLIVAMIFEHKYTIPSFMTYWNQQWWSHHNPAREEMRAIQEHLDRIERLLKEKRT